MMLRYSVFALVALTLNGCVTVGGSAEEEDLNSTVLCTDIRDGEKFSFNTSTISGIKASFGGEVSSYRFKDNDGNTRMMRENSHLYLKCKIKGK